MIEAGSHVIPIEIKASGTIDTSWGRGISAFQKMVKKDRDRPGYVISLNPTVAQIAPHVINLPISCFL